MHLLKVLEDIRDQVNNGPVLNKSEETLGRVQLFPVCLAAG